MCKENFSMKEGINLSPILSTFYGIVVRINTERNEPHHTPHIHAYYQGAGIAMDFEGNILANDNFPPKKIRMLQTWIDIHCEDLIANWDIWNNDGEYFKIDPLR